MKRFLPKLCAEPDAQRLSDQERAVLELSNKGYSYDEIAQLLHLTRNTIGTYVKRIYRKLQAHSKSEAIYEARKQGFLRD
jgi:DNA-binding NarL/FixJ family response regulator